MRLTRWAVVRGALAAGLALTLAGCGGAAGSPEAAPSASAEAGAPALHSFDVYAVAGADGNILQADLYGITLNPLRAYRLTTGKKVSYASADADTVVVAAADTCVDQLAQVADGGVLEPIPGLGRPHAFTPQVQSGGSIHFADDESAGDAEVSRYVAWDPGKQAKTVLYRGGGLFDGAGTGPGGQFSYVLHEPKADDSIVTVTAKARSTRSRSPRRSRARSGARS